MANVHVDSLGNVTLKGQLGVVPVYRFQLTNDLGLKASVLTYGATLQKVELPNGRVVTVNQESAQGVVDQEFYMGNVVGRVAGRTTIGSGTEALPANDGKNHLHGGILGFDKRAWELSSVIFNEEEVGVDLCRTSPDGEEGYIGSIETHAQFILSRSKLRLVVRLTAKSLDGKESLVNMTSHPYWNLDDKPSTIHNHHLKLNCSKYVELREDKIPTGKLLSVEGTGMDFREARSVGESIENFDVSLGQNYGYDKFVVVDPEAKEETVVVQGQPVSVVQGAILSSSNKDLRMEISSNQPGFQMYSSNYLPLDGKAPYCRHGALCLEPMAYPDSVTQSSFPASTVNGDREYENVMVHDFILQ